MANVLLHWWLLKIPCARHIGPYVYGSLEILRYILWVVCIQHSSITVRDYTSQVIFKIVKTEVKPKKDLANCFIQNMFDFPTFCRYYHKNDLLTNYTKKPPSSSFTVCIKGNIFKLSSLTLTVYFLNENHYIIKFSIWQRTNNDLFTILNVNFGKQLQEPTPI